jgi:O-antigen/teichoic acid export membrane protein
LSTNTTGAATNTQTVARNSFWYGVELGFNIFSAIVTSILVARAFGPVRLGPFNYVMWLTNITTAVGSFGLPMTTRKYMAEHLNRGEAGVAHSIYRAALRLQVLIGAAVLAAGVGLVYAVGDPGYRLISILLVMNMAPRMIGLIPSQANNAAEMMRWNTMPALAGAALNVSATLLCLWMGVGLEGIAAAVAAGSMLETGLKLRRVQAWLGPTPRVAISPELKRRLVSYSGQGLVLMMLNVVVWDRSDMVILKAMNRDIRQITFFSLAFNLADRLLKLPEAFGNSLSVTMMAQYGRGQDRLQHLMVVGAKYSFLLAVPLLAGVACVSGPAVSLLYGQDYRPLIPVLAITAVLAIPKALIAAPTALLQTTENQSFLIWTGCVCGAFDIGMDFWLTPTHGAIGAALANGLAQTAAAIAIWARVHRLYQMGAALRAFWRIGLAGAAMVGVVWAGGHWISGYAGIAVLVLAGALVWFLGLRVAGALDSGDRERFLVLGKRLPGGLHPLFRRSVEFLTARPPA